MKVSENLEEASRFSEWSTASFESSGFQGAKVRGVYLRKKFSLGGGSLSFRAKNEVRCIRDKSAENRFFSSTLQSILKRLKNPGLLLGGWKNGCPIKQVIQGASSSRKSGPVAGLIFQFRKYNHRTYSTGCSSRREQGLRWL